MSTAFGTHWFEALDAWGHGLEKPEDVAVTVDGRVYASGGGGAAITEILADGSLRRVGVSSGRPNGINLTVDGDAILIADIGGDVLQECELATGSVTTLVDQVAGRRLRRPNYPIVTRDGTVYWTSSCQADDAVGRIVDGVADGYIARLTPSGAVDIVADGLAFANGLALDADEGYLYCCRTTASDVVRFRIEADGTLGPLEPHGPPFGDRRADEYGDKAAWLLWGDRPVRTLGEADPNVLHRWGMTDGCGFDVEGNLYVATFSANRIDVITPDLDVVVAFDDEARGLLPFPTNIAFGGADMRDVYFGSVATSYVVRGRSRIPGLPTAAQRA